MSLFKQSAPKIWHFVGLAAGLTTWFVARDIWLTSLADPWYVRYGSSALVAVLLSFLIEFVFKVLNKKSEKSL